MNIGMGYVTVAAQLGAAPRRGWAKKAQDEAREGRSYKQWGSALKTFFRPWPRPTSAPSTHPSDVGPSGAREGAETGPRRGQSTDHTTSKTSVSHGCAYTIWLKALTRTFHCLLGQCNIAWHGYLYRKKRFSF